MKRKLQTSELGRKFKNTVALKLRRDYSENEGIKFLSFINDELKYEVSDLKLKLGMLLSEKQELEDKCKEYEDKILELNSMLKSFDGLERHTVKHWTKDEAVKLIYDETVSLKKINNDLKKESRMYRDKFIALSASLIQTTH